MNTLDHEYAVARMTGHGTAVCAPSWVSGKSRDIGIEGAEDHVYA